ncbi:unnamed protein product [Amoebophrya sp. A25]|nr:unnamed protein product [Amoebophrya sp. A25]|eukprot:GSA25T00004436001.1
MSFFTFCKRPRGDPSLWIMKPLCALLIPVFMLAGLLKSVDAAMNLEPHEVDKHVTQLRKHIFVDVLSISIPPHLAREYAAEQRKLHTQADGEESTSAWSGSTCAKRTKQMLDKSHASALQRKEGRFLVTELVDHRSFDPAKYELPPPKDIEDAYAFGVGPVNGAKGALLKALSGMMSADSVKFLTKVLDAGTAGTLGLQEDLTALASLMGLKMKGPKPSGAERLARREKRAAMAVMRTMASGGWYVRSPNATVNDTQREFWSRQHWDVQKANFDMKQVVQEHRRCSSLDGPLCDNTAERIQFTGESLVPAVVHNKGVYRPGSFAVFAEEGDMIGEASLFETEELLGVVAVTDLSKLWGTGSTNAAVAADLSAFYVQSKPRFVNMNTTKLADKMNSGPESEQSMHFESSRDDDEYKEMVRQVNGEQAAFLSKQGVGVGAGAADHEDLNQEPEPRALEGGVEAAVVEDGASGAPVVKSDDDYGCPRLLPERIWHHRTRPVVMSPLFEDLRNGARLDEQVVPFGLPVEHLEGPETRHMLSELGPVTFRGAWMKSQEQVVQNKLQSKSKKNKKNGRTSTSTSQDLLFDQQKRRKHSHSISIRDGHMGSIHFSTPVLLRSLVVRAASHTRATVSGHARFDRRDEMWSVSLRSRAESSTVCLEPESAMMSTSTIAAARSGSNIQTPSSAPAAAEVERRTTKTNQGAVAAAALKTRQNLQLQNATGVGHESVPNYGYQSSTNPPFSQRTMDHKSNSVRQEYNEFGVKKWAHPEKAFGPVVAGALSRARSGVSVSTIATSSCSCASEQQVEAQMQMNDTKTSCSARKITTSSSASAQQQDQGFCAGVASVGSDSTLDLVVDGGVSSLGLRAIDTLTFRAAEGLEVLRLDVIPAAVSADSRPSTLARRKRRYHSPRASAEDEPAITTTTDNSAAIFLIDPNHGVQIHTGINANAYPYLITLQELMEQGLHLRQPNAKRTRHLLKSSYSHGDGLRKDLGGAVKASREVDRLFFYDAASKTDVHVSVDEEENYYSAKDRTLSEVSLLWQGATQAELSPELRLNWERRYDPEALAPHKSRKKGTTFPTALGSIQEPFETINRVYHADSVSVKKDKKVEATGQWVKIYESASDRSASQPTRSMVNNSSSIFSSGSGRQDAGDIVDAKESESHYGGHKRGKEAAEEFYLIDDDEDMGEDFAWDSSEDGLFNDIVGDDDLAEDDSEYDEEEDDEEDDDWIDDDEWGSVGAKTFDEFALDDVLGDLLDHPGAGGRGTTVDIRDADEDAGDFN